MKDLSIPQRCYLFVIIQVIHVQDKHHAFDPAEVQTKVVKLLLIVIVIVMTDLWHNSNSNSNRLLKIQE